MDKTYDPHKLEAHWYKTWENRQYFSPSDADQSYCIMIPPPNVTGTLHMGHGFSNTIIDILIRYHRMKGYSTLWQPGTDHAGIATQMVVERQLNAEGIRREELGRIDFVNRVWDWKEKSGGTITQQLRRLGASADWSRERFTMDDGLSYAVQKVFIQLYNEGIIYRGNRLVNWDPDLLTALSDLEVLNEEENGHLWHLKYPLSDGSSELIVATTRPETMLGDTAVAVHPEDTRYQNLIGKHISLPLTNREIPIIGDDYVDPEFGSGCVKITPAHDFNDYEVGKRHNLPMINILDRKACINANAPQKYRGLDRFVARKQVIADFEALNLLTKVEDHKLKVPRGDRSNSIVEPFLTDQWYVDLTRDVQPDGRPGGKQLITDPSIDVVRNGDIKFVPENWNRTYYQWLDNIQDWCISRQLWWGHRIPAWYDDNGNIYVGESEVEIREKHQLDDSLSLKQDEDVLDTWFSSALWPFSTLGWPEKTDGLKSFYPTSVLVTGFDIIFFWVARMIMFGMKFMDKQVPFHEVYIHGLVRDSNGQKMSKSKGNVLDPLDIIDGISLEDLLQKRTGDMMQPHLAEKVAKQTQKEFPNGIASVGTDALRFTFAALASTGRDVRFDMNRVEGYRNFCNKVWNASRYVLMNVEEHKDGINHPDLEFSLVDRWIIHELNHLSKTVSQHLDKYRFDLAAQALYDFTWNEYCDWYLELTKPILSGDSSENLKNGTRHTLVNVFESLLRLIHPIMPFITEELWQQYAPMAGINNETIMLERYPEFDTNKADEHACDEITWVKAFVMGVRKIRSEMNIPPGKKLPVLLENASESDQQRLQAHVPLLSNLARLESAKILMSEDITPESATALIGELKLLIPLAGLIDKEAELKRLDKEINKLDKEIQRITGKLGNDKFVANAPQNVVEKEKQKLSDTSMAHRQFTEQKSKIQTL